MSLPGNRRRAILKFIFTAATVASVKGDTGDLVEAGSGWSMMDMLSLSGSAVQSSAKCIGWYLILGIAIFLAGGAAGVIVGSRRARAGGEPTAGAREARAKADRAGKPEKQKVYERIYVTEHGYHRSLKFHTDRACSSLQKARDHKQMEICYHCSCHSGYGRPRRYERPDKADDTDTD